MPQAAKLAAKDAAILALVSELQHLEETRTSINDITKILEEKALTIVALEADKLRLKQEVEAQDTVLVERAALLAERDSALEDRATALEERAGLLAERNAELQHSAVEAAEQERLLHNLVAEKQELEEAHNSMKEKTQQELDKKDQEVRMLQGLVLQHEETLASIETVNRFVERLCVLDCC